MEEGWYEEEEEEEDEDEEVVVKSENVASSRSRSHPLTRLRSERVELV